MSWLTDIIHRKATVAQVVAKSFAKLQRLTGIHLTDDQADEISKRVDDATDAAEAAFRELIAAKAPALPAAIATMAVEQALNFIDGAVATAMQTVKDNN